MIKAIMFDADGVLINTERFSNQLTRDYGISTEMTKPFFEGPFAKCLTGKCDLKEEIAPYLDKWGWNKGVDAFLDYWFTSEHKVDEELVLYIQALRKQGLVCVVATNQEKHRAEYMLQKMGFENSFDGLYASGHLGHKKPSSDFYEKVFNTFKDMNKKEVLFWDDDTENVLGAREFGINAEQYISFEDFKQKMSSYIN